MIHSLSNAQITIQVDELGAELQSLTYKNNEYIWQGNPTYWGKRSPLLFPNIGKVWEGVYRHQGKTYEMPKHGFALTRHFQLIERTENSLSFLLESDEKTLENYPFPFQLIVSYRLEAKTLFCQYIIKNTGDDTMYFQIGGHPGFNLQDFKDGEEPLAYLSFDKECLNYILVGEGGCANPEVIYDLVFDEEGLFPILPSTFDNDALMFENNQIRCTTLYNKEKQAVLHFRTNAPVMAFWSPVGGKAPFICFEPWYGRCDRQFFTGTLQQRDCIQKLPPFQTFYGEYSIELL